VINKITYRTLVISICLVAVLSTLSLGISIVAFSRQASIAETKANQAIAAAQQGSADAMRSTCMFVLAFIPKPGEPPATTERGELLADSARRLYTVFQCPKVTGPLPK
jgi:hypothetical protein